MSISRRISKWSTTPPRCKSHGTLPSAITITRETFPVSCITKGEGIVLQTVHYTVWNNFFSDVSRWNMPDRNYDFTRKILTENGTEQTAFFFVIDTNTFLSMLLALFAFFFFCCCVVLTLKASITRNQRMNGCEINWLLSNGMKGSFLSSISYELRETDMEWLETRLREIRQDSPDEWIIVFGHHPIFNHTGTIPFDTARTHCQDSPSLKSTTRWWICCSSTASLSTCAAMRTCSRISTTRVVRAAPRVMRPAIPIRPISLFLVLARESMRRRFASSSRNMVQYRTLYVFLCFLWG